MKRLLSFFVLCIFSTSAFDVREGLYLLVKPWKGCDIQKEMYYIGTKVYNNLPLYIKAVSKDLKKFEEKLKSFYKDILFIHYRNISVINNLIPNSTYFNLYEKNSYK
jgi:hypothetical protein